MPISLKMPALSPTMEEGTLAKWLIKEGDMVSSGDLMAEIETDKATMEFEAVDEGVLAKILISEGTDNVKVGEVIAILAEDGEDVANIDVNSASTVAPSEASKKATETPSVNSTPASPETSPSVSVSKSNRIKASPLARRIAAEKEVDLASLVGSGPKGRIVKSDVENAGSTNNAAATISATAPSAVTAPVAQCTPVDPGDIPHEVQKLSNMRKTIARRLTEAKQAIPHIYLTVDINLDKLLKLRSELNTGLEARGVKLSVNDLLIKALAQALIAVPKCNVSFAGDNLIQYHRADISVAVSIDGGLITPIVANANEKSLSTISNEVKDLAGRAKEGKLQPHEYQGGTASLSNMGMFGIKQFDAVINPPQAMIMAISAGEKRPAVIDDSLQIATMMSATGSFDHRAIDGADGAQLMKVFKELVENPLSMLA